VIVVAGICSLLAYEVNWIHQRRRFLEEQVAQGVRGDAMRPLWVSGAAVNNVNQPGEGAYRKAPIESDLVNGNCL
jgi:hypothetical protein